MAKQFTPTPNKTYATAANAVKAVEKLFPSAGEDNLNYLVLTDADGRFYPLFIGNRAVEKMVHFHFNVMN